MFCEEKRIIILFQVSATFGYGHLYRSIRIGKLLQERYHVLLLCNENEKAKEMAATQGLELIPCDIDCTNNVIEHSADLIILDRLNNDVSYVQEIRKYIPHVIALDETGDAAKNVEVLINGIRTLPEIIPSRSYHGLEYMVFDDDIEYFSKKKKNRSGDYLNVLLAFGGSDPNRISSLMLPIIRENKQVNFSLILGPGFENLDEFLVECKAEENLKCFVNISNMAEMLYKADLCIVSGGLTMYECAYLQKKMIIACQVEHQVINAEGIQDISSQINLGIINQEKKEKIDLINEVLKGKKEIPEPKTIHNFVNGKYRIVEIVDELLEERK